MEWIIGWFGSSIEILVAQWCGGLSQVLFNANATSQTGGLSQVLCKVHYGLLYVESIETRK
jgi:hypothetical protein